MSAAYMVKFETLDGMCRWRAVPNLEHKTLCRAGGLAESITWFDIAKSFFEGDRRSGRTLSGQIHQGAKDAPPVGRITLVFPEDRAGDNEEHSDMLKRIGCSLDYVPG